MQKHLIKNKKCFINNIHNNMVNEALRKKQYREVLDADKKISRQVYDLYQRQETAYREGKSSIRNMNQLTVLAGVLEAVSALESQLQTLTQFQDAREAVFFVPTVQSFNKLMVALRSIDKVYKTDTSVKYEVDKMLKPVIDKLQSLASAFVYDPAVANRLSQMRINLLSKVYERIDFNTGKREYKSNDNLISDGRPSTRFSVQTEKDTLAQPTPFLYESARNEPFANPIEPEKPLQQPSMKDELEEQTKLQELKDEGKEIIRESLKNHFKLVSDELDKTISEHVNDESNDAEIEGVINEFFTLWFSDQNIMWVEFLTPLRERLESYNFDDNTFQELVQFFDQENQRLFEDTSKNALKKAKISNNERFQELLISDADEKEEREEPPTSLPQSPILDLDLSRIEKLLRGAKNYKALRKEFGKTSYEDMAESVSQQLQDSSTDRKELVARLKALQVELSPQRPTSSPSVSKLKQTVEKAREGKKMKKEKKQIEKKLEELRNELVSEYRDLDKKKKELVSIQKQLQSINPKDIERLKRLEKNRDNALAEVNTSKIANLEQQMTSLRQKLQELDDGILTIDVDSDDDGFSLFD